MEDITRIQAIKRDPQLALRAVNSGQLHKLSGEILVGRETECNIQIISPQVSRYHAKISVSANGVFIEDLESSNGTFVNGTKIHQRTLINLNDEVCFDELCYRVTSARENSAEPTSVSAGGSSEGKPGFGRLRSGAAGHYGDHASAPRKSMGDLLKPAPAHPSEYKAPPKSAFDSLVKPPSPSANTPAAQMPSAPANEQSPAAKASESGRPSGGIGPVPPPKAQEIEDIEAFLRFAGSGLQPQEPISPREVSPFGLMKKNRPGAPTSQTPVKARQHAGLREGNTQTNAPQPATTKPQVAEAPAAQAAKASAKRESEVDDKKSALKAALGDKHDARLQTRLEDSPEELSRSKNRGFTGSAAALKANEDEESTKFLGLNAINQYVSTNQKFQRDLDLGSGPRLIAMTAPIRGKVFTLASDDDVSCWSIGRDDSADICLRDKVVSREHAWITKLDALYQLRVNETASGISVNGETCTEADLHHGDRLQLGTMELVFRLDIKQSEDGGASARPTWRQRLKQFFVGTG